MVDRVDVERVQEVWKPPVTERLGALRRQRDADLAQQLAEQEVGLVVDVEEQAGGVAGEQHRVVDPQAAVGERARQGVRVLEMGLVVGAAERLAAEDHRRRHAVDHQREVQQPGADE